MSVGNILNPTTIDQKWSSAYLYSLDAKNLSVAGESVSSGTYSPTISADSGSIGVIIPSCYSKIGQIMNFSGRFAVILDSSATQLVLTISLPPNGGSINLSTGLNCQCSILGGSSSLLVTGAAAGTSTLLITLLQVGGGTFVAGAATCEFVCSYLIN